MENKVIAKEYIDKNYVHKDLIREILQETEEQIKEFDKYVKESTGEVSTGTLSLSRMATALR